MCGAGVSWQAIVTGNNRRRPPLALPVSRGGCGGRRVPLILPIDPGNVDLRRSVYSLRSRRRPGVSLGSALGVIA